MRALLMVGFSILAVAPTAAGQNRPFLTAQYDPGLSAQCGWKTEIDNAGTVTRFVEPKLKSGKCDAFAWPRPRLRRVGAPAQLSRDQFDELKRAIAESDLPTVPFHATPGVDCAGNPFVTSDADELSIELFDGAVSRKSGIYAWRRVAEASDPRCPNTIKNDVRRFLSVWAVVLDTVGSPNAGDSPNEFAGIVEAQQ
jgi:hypothetical protein